jgi:hypothetical protein
MGIARYQLRPYVLCCPYCMHNAHHLLMCTQLAQLPLRAGTYRPVILPTVLPAAIPTLLPQSIARQYLAGNYSMQTGWLSITVPADITRNGMRAVAS